GRSPASSALTADVMRSWPLRSAGKCLKPPRSQRSLVESGLSRTACTYQEKAGSLDCCHNAERSGTAAGVPGVSSFRPFADQRARMRNSGPRPPDADDQKNLRSLPPPPARQHPREQVGVSRVVLELGAWVGSDALATQRHVAALEGALEPRECLVVVAQACIDPGDISGGGLARQPQGLQLAGLPARVVRVASLP